MYGTNQYLYLAIKISHQFAVKPSSVYVVNSAGTNSQVSVSGSASNLIVGGGLAPVPCQALRR